MTGQVQGLVELQGVVRKTEVAKAFTPDNDPARNAWYRLDSAEMALSRGMANPDSVLLVDAVVAPEDVKSEQAKGIYPMPHSTKEYLTHFVMPEKHVAYSATWYGFTAIIIVMTRKLMKTKF